MFPPGKSGGLIEALLLLADAVDGGLRFRRVNPAASLKPRPLCGPSWPAGNVFPPGKSGGLIEAVWRSRRGCYRHRPFPPGKSGGLIEAALALFHRATRFLRFRRVNPAASLKLEVSSGILSTPVGVSAG